MLQFIVVQCDPMCLNGGICAEDHSGNEICFCPPGYSGNQCEYGKGITFNIQKYCIQKLS